MFLFPVILLAPSPSLNEKNFDPTIDLAIIKYSLIPFSLHLVLMKNREEGDHLPKDIQVIIVSRKENARESESSWRTHTYARMHACRFFGIGRWDWRASVGIEVTGATTTEPRRRIHDFGGSHGPRALATSCPKKFGPRDAFTSLSFARHPLPGLRNPSTQSPRLCDRNRKWSHRVIVSLSIRWSKSQCAFSFRNDGSLSPLLNPMSKCAKSLRILTEYYNWLVFVELFSCVNSWRNSRCRVNRRLVRDRDWRVGTRRRLCLGNSYSSLDFALNHRCATISCARRWAFFKVDTPRYAQRWVFSKVGFHLLLL